MRGCTSHTRWPLELIGARVGDRQAYFQECGLLGLGVMIEFGDSPTTPYI